MKDSCNVYSVRQWKVLSITALYEALRYESDDTPQQARSLGAKSLPRGMYCIALWLDSVQGARTSGSRHAVRWGIINSTWPRVNVDSICFTNHELEVLKSILCTCGYRIWCGDTLGFVTYLRALRVHYCNVSPPSRNLHFLAQTKCW